jgi:hypothetical protein
MSEQTNPEGSRRSNREVTRDMAALFMPREEPEEEQFEEQDQPEATDLVEDEEIAAEAGEDIEEGEQADAEGEEHPSDFQWTLQVAGQERVLTDEEEARNYAMKGMHYTQEMQALREEQRQWEAEREATTAQIRQQEQQYTEALRILEETFSPILGEEPDWVRLSQENPEQYQIQRAQWDQLAEFRKEQQRIAAQRQQEHQQRLQQAAQRERQALFDKLPEWSDESKRQADIDMIREYAYMIGYNDQELGSLWNHRDFLVLRDAARYRKAAAAGQREVKKASKTVEPGKSTGPVSAKSRRERQIRERARKTGRVQDVAASLERLLS